MPTKTPVGVALAALVLSLAALPAAAEAAGPVELRLTHPRSDPRFGELVLDARCAQACTLRLTELNAMPYIGSTQGPHAARGELGITRRLPAGKLATIRIGVPLPVQGAVASVLPRRATLVGNVAVTVTTGGETYDVGRQFTVVAPGETAPFPASATVDAFTVPIKPPAPPRRAKPPYYAMTISGTQTSRWSYDRTESSGACTTVDSGSGTQTLRFRSVRAQKVRQVWWRDGYRELQEQYSPAGGVSAPVRIDAERDSVARKGVQGDCGNYGGDDPGTPQCTRRGSVVADMGVFFRRTELVVSSTMLSWKRPSTAPDCPVETAGSLYDPLDILDTPAKRGEDLSRGGSPGKVILVFRASDVTPLKGGSVTTTVLVKVTFRKLG
jgi:hypothetical protein